MRSNLTTNLASLTFAFAVLSTRAAERHFNLITNQPPSSSIVRFETARLDGKHVKWQTLSRQDGEFIMKSLPPLSDWRPKWSGDGAPGCILPPPNDFAVRVITKSGRHYDMTFTTRAGLVWIDKRLLDVPDATATQVVRRVEKALNRK